MTSLLQQALGGVERRSAAEQDAIAEIILEELADEECWQQAFAKSPEKLAILADQAVPTSPPGACMWWGINEL